MKLWSHMSLEQLEQAQGGVLRSSEGRVQRESPWGFSYGWMVGQMEKRIGPRPDGIVTPVWAWHSFGGVNKQPDLRLSTFSGYDDYMVALDIPDERVVLSDYQLWHYVLNNWYLPMNQEEADSIDLESNIYKWPNEPWEEAFYARFKELEAETGDRLLSHCRAAVEVYGKSWEQIFLVGEDRYAILGIADDEPEYQATMWEIRAEDIVGVKKINRRSRSGDIAVAKKKEERNRIYWENYKPSKDDMRFLELVEFGRSIV